MLKQALEAACWIPILKGRRLVLAGDHKQVWHCKGRQCSVWAHIENTPLMFTAHLV